jgi:hypothetical protein
MLENPFFTIWKEEGIVYIRYNEVVIDEAIMKNVMDSYYRITSYEPHVIFSDGSRIKYWTKEARAYQVKFENPQYMKAAAILVKSPVQQIFVNFFLVFHKPKIPVKLFISKEEALSWLSTYQ